MEFVVDSQAELNAALSKAVAGDSIVLVKIADSYNIRMHDKDYSGSGVKISSQNPNDMAIVDTIHLTASSNIHFSNLDVNSHTYDPGRADWLTDVYVSDSSNISISNSVFSGDATAARLTTNSYVAESFATVRESNGFVLENNTISNYNFGLLLLETTDVKVNGNEFHSLQGDPIRMAGVQRVDITNNNIHDLLGTDESLNHMDMIQIWSTSTNLVTRDITISGNILDAGNGVASQSIFIRNEKVDTSENANLQFYYSNITIKDNLIYNGHLHGITVGETNGLVISNNTLVTNPQSSMIVGGGTRNVTYDPAINVANAATGVTITNNITSAITAPDSARVSGNYFVDYVNQSADNYVGNVFLFAQNGGDVDVSDLRLSPNGPLGSSSIGAEVSQFDRSPDTLNPVVTLEKVNGLEQVFILKANYTADARGFVSASDATFTWTFEDGTVLRGQSVQVAFDQSGDLNVSLTVQTAREKATVSKTVYVEDPVIFSLTAKSGKVTDSSPNNVDFVAGNVAETIHIGQGVTFEVTRNNSEIYSLDQFTLSFDMKRKAVSGQDETLAMLHQAMSLTLTEEGELALGLTNDAGKRFELVSTGANLNDTGWHNVVLSFDGIGGDLEIFVDGAKVGEMSADGSTKNKEYWGLVFGNPWRSGNSFKGELDNIVMTSDPYSTTPYSQPGITVPDQPSSSPPDNSSAEPIILKFTDDDGTGAGIRVSNFDDNIQDKGTVTVSSGGESITLYGNAWKVLDLQTNIDADTVISFDFKADIMGEIFALGFVKDGKLVQENVVQFGGTQNWGHQLGEQYSTTGVSQRFELKVGQHVTGSVEKIVLIADNDAYGGGTTNFSNISINSKDVLLVNGIQLPVESFKTGIQDYGLAAISADSTEVTLTGNAWKKIETEFTVTEDTLLSFNFESRNEAEIYAIGFLKDGEIREDYVFELEGTQNWGRQDLFESGEDGHYEVLVGDHFRGEFDGIVLIADDDLKADADATFSNITIGDADFA
ncbi:right-handed parallel beta-helix repeat-containing protein [Roseibium sp. MMSF_3412]|uniref:right-handed parallel beta-helix repeat-containing protein n=1 Tax=Roseibium sp. MMSF_3412 TaxID=3046712 RepID=UPI00273DF958|nr:right-handed parallel beta-helix repeat-containing protein [Roseibium sp. MMSF_3412]